MKKLLSLFLCAVMLLSAAACGNQGGGSTTTPHTTENTGGTTSGTTVSTNATTTGTIVPEPDITRFDEDNIVLSFGALSDIHITGASRETNKFRASINQLIAEAAKHDANGLYAIAIAGDIADTGKTSQVQIFSDVCAEFKNTSLGTNVMLTTGNHDFYGDADAHMQNYYNIMGAEYFKNDVECNTEKGYRHCVVNGYHFIFIEPTSYGKGCPYGESVLTWLDNTLKSITDEDPNAYVFVFTHPMIYKTCYGSELGPSWYTTHLTSTLSKYPQVVTFGGHLHFPINDERSIMQTAFTSLGCGSVRYLAIEGGYANANGTVPFDAHSVSSGLLVQIDKNGNARITRMDFSNESTFKTPWEISFPTATGDHLKKYTTDRANSNTAPVLSGEITFTKSSADPLKGTMSIPAGTDDDLVHHYIVKISKAGGQVVSTQKFLSDFYRHPDPSGMKDTFTCDFSVPSDGEYTITFTAVDSWGAQSNTLSLNVTAGNAEPLPSELPDTYADIDFTQNGVTDAKNKLDLSVVKGSVVNTPLTFAGKTANVNAFTVTAAGQYVLAKFSEYGADTITNFYNSATGYSVEAVFVNRAYSTSKNQGIVCGTQSGGWGIAQNHTSGVPYLYTYVSSGSSSLQAKAATPKNELTHVLATFIYSSSENKTYISFYINGELVASDAKTGKIAISSSEKAANAFCLGSDIASDGSGSDFPMTDFAITDVKIYAVALNYKQAKTAYNTAVSNFGN